MDKTISRLQMAVGVLAIASIVTMAFAGAAGRNAEMAWQPVVVAVGGNDLSVPVGGKSL